MNNKQQLEQKKSEIIGVKSATERLIASLPADHPSRAIGMMAINAMDKDLKQLDYELENQAPQQPKTFGKFLTNLIGNMPPPKAEVTEPCQCGKHVLQLEIHFGDGMTKVDALKMARKKLKEIIAAEEKAAG